MNKIENSNIQHWLIPSSPDTFEAIAAFEELGEIDWGNASNNKINIDDIVYIYISKPVQAIAIKAKVIKINITNNDLLDNDNNYIRDKKNYFRLKLISFTNRDTLSLNELESNGLKGRIQGKSKLENNKQLLEYILNNEQQNKGQNIMKNHQDQPLNQILYGPPGTGKTYNTINKAIEIIENRTVTDDENRKDLKKQFDIYKESGQIEFITFHQSYGYEEFVEGIKADLSSGSMEYKLETGVFKKLTNKAERNFDLSRIKDEDELKTISLFNKKINSFIEQIEGKLNSEKSIHIDKTSIDIVNIENNRLIYKGLAWNKQYYFNFTDLLVLDKYKPQRKEDIKLLNGISKTALHHQGYYFGLYMLFNDLTKNINLNSSESVEIDLKNYILIIDEINRGNISKIFGELITLIEPSKRIGEAEEIRLTLPNSPDEKFGVPSNLYIIGTMNTADRSIAQIDTALRRRFVFEEMMPKPDLLKNIVVDGIEIEKVLEAINERIEYILDREHTIGHSYFMPLIDNHTKAKLDEIFRVNIIPLLAEYFYGDWGDIVEILNDQDGNFIKEKTLTYTTKTKRENKVYEIQKEFIACGYKKIYNAECQDESELENKEDIE